VADAQPIYHPPQTGQMVRNLSFLLVAARAAKMTPQTVAQPTL
jgi:hypothetical protein